MQIHAPVFGGNLLPPSKQHGAILFIHTRAVIEVAYGNYRREIQHMAQRSQMHVLNPRVVLR